MATLNFSDCKIDVYKYILKQSVSKNSNNWIPIVVVTLPANYTWSGTLSFNEGTGDRLGDMGFSNYSIPFWIFMNNSKLFNYTFLESSTSDPFFSVNVIMRSSDYEFSATFKDSDGNSLQSYTHSYNYPTGSSELYTALIPYFVRDTNNNFYNATQLIGDGNNYAVTGVVNVYDLPTESVSKGLLNSTNISVISYSGFAQSYVSTKEQKRIEELLKVSRNIADIDDNDPNDTSGNSKGGGGGGDGDIGGNPHKTGELPTISALDSGLITLYNPTVANLQSLGQFLWSDSFDVNTFKKLFNDPFDTLLGLSIVPIKPTVSGTHNIIFGNMDSGISCSVVSKQWVPVDCGSFTLNEVWNGALDYSPATQVSIYLPFIGVRQLNVNDVMGSTLHLYYNFDVLTGSCVAEITINHSSQGNKSNGFSYNADMGSVYTFMGQCSVNIPLSSMDFTNTIRAAINSVGMVAGAAAACATGNPALGVASLMMGTAQAGMQASTPTVERSGHLSSSNAFLASLEPCLFVQRPHICKPSRYYALRGVPSQVYASKLSSATGYFQIADVQNIHASGASDSELTEIKQLLTQGVFVDNWS